MSLGGSNQLVPDASSSTTSSTSRHPRMKKPPTPPFVLSSLAMRTIQEIHDISREVFAAADVPGFQPSPANVARLSGFLNGLTLEDFGLDPTMKYFKPESRGRSKVTYLHFESSNELSFGVFCLPHSAVIPLHDHPGMTVFSKILMGAMHMRSYDWVAPMSGGNAMMTPSGARLAKLHADSVLDASSETVVLYPQSGGNLHRFTAVSPCALLDVMGPPYCHDQGRDCSYYRGRTMISGGEEFAWLKQVPCTLQMDTIMKSEMIEDPTEMVI
ncbi:hypothetical protein ACP4OV_011557 [Aristida adscensionis]